MIFDGHSVFRDGTNAEEAAGARETNHTEAKVPEKNKTAENAAKTSKKTAKKTSAKKAAKKSAAPKVPKNKSAEKKTSKRAGRAERLSSEQIAAKREEMKKYLTTRSHEAKMNVVDDAAASPKTLMLKLGVNANQLRRILGGCDGVEKVGTVGRNVKYKLAG